MANVARHASIDELRGIVDRLASQRDPGVPRSFTQAMKSFLAACEYQDLPLVQSTLRSAGEAFASAIDEAIESRLGWPKQAREGFRSISDHIREWPNENWDDLGTAIEAKLDEMLAALIDLRDGPVQSLRNHYEIRNGPQLESDIKELQKIKQTIVERWPWSTHQLPPVDRVMVAASMNAFKNGEKGESIESLSLRLKTAPLLKADA